MIEGIAPQPGRRAVRPASRASSDLMVDRNLRSLDHLEASTARVLNLRAVARAKGDQPEYKDQPLFKNPALNSSIIVKHRLRAHR